MIYLDYSATTPVRKEVLDSYITATKEFIGNTNSIHSLGSKSNELLKSAKEQIAKLLDVNEEEIIFTSGATEGNNMIIKGVAKSYSKFGKHILVSKLEHPSIYEICKYLETEGFIIDYVDNNEEGLIDFEDLKKKIYKDTILVSICAVNSELGIRQPLKLIKQMIHKQNEKTLFHSDITQAIGKVSINLHDVDLASMSAHKIYGPKGVGFVYKNAKVKLIPLIHGSGKSNELRPGTPALPLIVALSKSLRLILEDLSDKENYVEKLNEKLCNYFSNNNILINKTTYSIPHILNISLMNIMPETFIHALEEHEIYVSTNTACSTNDVSSSIMAIYKDVKRASTSIRISISYLTTRDEINKFINVFDECYKKLIIVNN